MRLATRLGSRLGLVPLGIVVLAAGCGHRRPQSAAELRPGVTISPVPGASTTRTAAGLTAGAVARLVAGADDFSAVRADLAAALALDPTYEPARLFAGIADFLAWAQRTLTDPSPAQGVLRDLLQRSGVADQNGYRSLWGFAPMLVEHDQGDIFDSTPSANAWLGWLNNELSPHVQALMPILDGISPSFAYLVPRARHSALTGLFADAPGTEIDYGDVRALRSALGVLLATITIVDAYDWANLVPNDFDRAQVPNLDTLAVIQTKYPTLGTLQSNAATQLLPAALNVLATAWTDYEKASQHVRNETKAQQDLGLLSIGDRFFATPMERSTFLSQEAAVRTWMQNLFLHAYNGMPLTLTTLPNGTPIGPNDRPTLLVSKFWQQGLALRSLYFLTIRDPIAGKTVLGVSAPSQLTSTMATVDGIVQQYNGVMPVPGDLQERAAAGAYAVRIDTPKVSTKTIDGSFGDWGQGATESLAAYRPVASSPFPHVDVGEIWVARDATNLYVHVNADLQSYLVQAGDSYDVQASSGSGHYQFVVHYVGPNGPVLSTYGSGTTSPIAMTGMGGIEMAFPLSGFGTDSWAELTIHVHAPSATPPLESERAELFVKMR